MIADSIGFVADRGREAVYDAEHFFDGYKADRDYALGTLRAARQAGARTLVLCDTNGGTMTDELLRIVADVRHALEADLDAPAVTWGIHTHNDAELAVANSMAAVTAGIRHVQATINGYGERAATPTWSASWPTWRSRPTGAGARRRRRPRRPDRPRPERRRDRQRRPGRLPAIRRTIGVRPQGRRPRGGRRQGRAELSARGPGGRRQRGSAGGVRARRPGEHRDPGRAARPSARWVSTRGCCRRSSSSSKARGWRSRARRRASSSSSDAMAGRLRAPFRIVDYTCLVEQRDGRELLAEATVKVEVDGEILHTAADGNGPVNALDAALRKALGAFYPQLDGVHLVDYKVRILDGGAATAARTRVVIDSADGDRTGRRWAATRTSSRLRRAPWPIRSSTRSGRPAPSCAGARAPLHHRHHGPVRPAATTRARGGNPDARTRPHPPSRALDRLVRLERPEPRRRRHRRPAITSGRRGRGQRRGRRAVPGGRHGARRRARPGIRGCSPTTSMPWPRAPTRRGLVTVGLAPPTRPGERGARRIHRRAREHEHHRGLDRGVHRGDQRDARRGALAGRDRSGRQPASGGKPRPRPARRGGPSSTRRSRSTTPSPGSSARSSEPRSLGPMASRSSRPRTSASELTGRR